MCGEIRERPARGRGTSAAVAERERDHRLRNSGALTGCLRVSGTTWTGALRSETGPWHGQRCRYKHVHRSSALVTGVPVPLTGLLEHYYDAICTYRPGRPHVRSGRVRSAPYLAIYLIVPRAHRRASRHWLQLDSHHATMLHTGVVMIRLGEWSRAAIYGDKDYPDYCRSLEDRIPKQGWE